MQPPSLFLSLKLVHFESFPIEYLAALAFSAVAVALGGLWGIAPDRGASGAITQRVPDCSLLLYSSPSRSYCLLLGTRAQALYQRAHCLIRVTHKNE